MTGSNTGSDSGENAGSMESVSVPDPTENLPDPTEKLDQTTPDTKASTFSGDADPALTNAFWRLVLAVDVGLLSLSRSDAHLVPWQLGGWRPACYGWWCRSSVCGLSVHRTSAAHQCR